MLKWTLKVEVEFGITMFAKLTIWYTNEHNIINIAHKNIA